MNAWMDVDVEHEGVMPTAGGAILAIRHVPQLDPQILLQILDRPVTVPGTDDLSVRDVRDLLADGHLVAMFPEGRRSRSGRLNPGHSGVAHLSLSTGCPIIPVGIVVADTELPRISVRVGSPIGQGTVDARPSMRARLNVADQTMCEITRLCGEAVSVRPSHLVQV